MKIWFDGSGWNGKKSKYCVVFEDKRPPIVKRFSENKTNNEMEYAGLLEALSRAVTGDELFTDSELVFHQVVTGKYKVREPRLKPLAEKARHLLREKNVSLAWIPRERNLAGHLFESRQ